MNFIYSFIYLSSHLFNTTLVFHFYNYLFFLLILVLIVSYYYKIISININSLPYYCITKESSFTYYLTLLFNFLAIYIPAIIISLHHYL